MKNNDYILLYGPKHTPIPLPLKLQTPPPKKGPFFGGGGL